MQRRTHDENGHTDRTYDIAEQLHRHPTEEAIRDPELSDITFDSTGVGRYASAWLDDGSALDRATAFNGVPAFNRR